jgi:hypothetical protein
LVSAAPVCPEASRAANRQEPFLAGVAAMRIGRWLLLASAWAVTVGFGLWNMLQYEMTPAAVSPLPNRWPANSSLHRDPERPTLVMFVHPHCPCSRASLDELMILVTRRGSLMSPTIVFLKPPGFDEKWEQTDLWRTAHSIPGATVICDADGVETVRFRARASGETLLYDRQGNLLFHGGITASRGHHGDNAGRSALELLLAGGTCSVTQTPVFGCSLAERTAAGRDIP